MITCAPCNYAITLAWTSHLTSSGCGILATASGCARAGTVWNGFGGSSHINTSLLRSNASLRQNTTTDSKYAAAVISPIRVIGSRSTRSSFRNLVRIGTLRLTQMNVLDRSKTRTLTAIQKL